MNWLDWALVIIIALSTLRGFQSGLIAGMARLLGLVSGLAVAFAGHKELASFLDREWKWGEKLSGYLVEYLPMEFLYNTVIKMVPVMEPVEPNRDLIKEQLVQGYAGELVRHLAMSVLELFCFIFLAVVIYLLVVFLMRAVSGTAAYAGLGILDRLGGLLLGLVRGVLVVLIIAGVLDVYFAREAMPGDGAGGLIGNAVSGSLLLSYAQVILELVKLNFPGWPGITEQVKYI